MSQILKHLSSFFSKMPIYVLIFSSLILAEHGEAAQKVVGKKHVQIRELATPPMFTEFSHEQFEAAKQKISQTEKRTIARVDSLDEASALSVDLKEIRSRLIGGQRYKSGPYASNKGPHEEIKTAEQLDTFIKELTTEYETLAPDAQFLAAQIINLKTFKSFIYRARDLFEQRNSLNGKWRGNKDPISHSAIIAGLRLAATGINVYLPTEQWKAGFDYIVSPMENMGPLIPDEGALQKFFSEEWLPSTSLLATRMLALENRFLDKKEALKPFYWDNKIMYGKANFFDDGDRYLLIGVPEIRLFTSGVFALMSGLYANVAYSLDGLFECADEVARTYGFRTMFDASSMTAEKRFKVISQYRNRLLKLQPGGQDWMIQSYSTLKSAIRYSELAWNQLERDENSREAQRNFLDPRAFAPFNQSLNAGFGNLHSLINGKGIKSAIVNGEVVEIDLYRFFNESPPSLLEFIPDKFNQDDVKSKIVEGKKLEYRNYLTGSPSHWKMEAFEKYFPRIKTREDVGNAARILNQAWCGWLVGMPMSLIVL